MLPNNEERAAWEAFLRRRGDASALGAEERRDQEQEAWDAFDREFVWPQHWGESAECKAEQVDDAWNDRAKGTQR